MRTSLAFGLIAAGQLAFASGLDAKECQPHRTSSPACKAQRGPDTEARAAVTAWRQAEFTRARNAEIEASMKAYSAQRAFANARNAEAEASSARVTALRAREFVRERNAEIARSIAASQAQRSFTAARNREIEASVAAAEAYRMKEFARARNAEIEVALAAYKSERTLQAFARARNAEAERSLAAANALRMKEFARARNAEIEVALAAYKSERAMAAFARARNAEAEASVAAVEARRSQEFAAARNREINLSVASYIADRQGSIMTGSIRRAGSPVDGAAACRAMESGVGTVSFARSAVGLSAGGKAALNKLAALAKVCPTKHIEIHAHSDASGSPKANKRLSQRRGRAVAAYLVKAGIDAGRLHIVAHGESRAVSQRIEFTITDRAALSAIAR